MGPFYYLIQFEKTRHNQANINNKKLPTYNKYTSYNSIKPPINCRRQTSACTGKHLPRA